MKFYIYVLFFFIMGTASEINAQDGILHYYVQLDGTKEKNFQLQYGKVIYDENYLPQKQPIESIDDYQALTKVLYQHVTQDDTHDQLNIFIHGIWSHHYFEWKNIIKELSKNVYRNGDKKTVLLSIIWDSSLNYFTGVRIARRKGDYLSSLMDELIDRRDDHTISIMCHSMGNRIFEHAIKSSKYYGQGNHEIDHLVSVGADLESKAFEKGSSLEYLPLLIKDITVYTHNNDRSLKMSKLVNKNLRLGLHGIYNLENKPMNMRTIDVSTIKYYEDLSSNFSNHRYFYKSKWVMKDLKSVIWEKDFVTNKTKLNLDNRLKLNDENNN